jgi:hypothetical protein
MVAQHTQRGKVNPGQPTSSRTTEYWVDPRFNRLSGGPLKGGSLTRFLPERPWPKRVQKVLLRANHMYFTLILNDFRSESLLKRGSFIQGYLRLPITRFVWVRNAGEASFFPVPKGP